MKQLIQLRGCMAAGKTSTAGSVLAQGKYTVNEILIGKKSYPYTYDAKKRWCVTGRYDQCVCGGLDGKIDNKNLMKLYLHKLMTELNPDVLIFEAVMYGLTFQFAKDLVQICRADGYDYTGILLAPPFEDILANISRRNGGKPISVDMLSEKYFRSFTAAEKMLKAGIRLHIENPLDYSLEDLHYIVDKYIL